MVSRRRLHDEQNLWMKASSILGHIGSCLVGSIASMSVFGLTLAAAWIVILQRETSLRLLAVLAAGALGMYAGGLVVGLLGRSHQVRRSLIFTLLFCTISFLYLFAISQATVLLIGAGAVIGLLSGDTARQLRRQRSSAVHEPSE